MVNTFLKSLAKLRSTLFSFSVLLFPRVLLASSTMPWEDGLLEIQHALTGTTAHIIIVIAIAMAGIAYTVGEHGSILRRAAGIIFGGSIATGATSIYLALKFNG